MFLYQVIWSFVCYGVTERKHWELGGLDLSGFFFCFFFFSLTSHKMTVGLIKHSTELNSGLEQGLITFQSSVLVCFSAFCDGGE